MPVTLEGSPVLILVVPPRKALPRIQTERGPTIQNALNDFATHDALFIFSDLLGKPTKTSCISNFILLHYMFQPSGPDHMLNKTGTVLKWFPPSSLPRK